MKTSFEIPDELFCRVRAQAALRRRKIKDYLAEGLRLVLEADDSKDSRVSGALAVFDEVRAQPLHQPEAIRHWMEAVQMEGKSFLGASPGRTGYA